MKTIAIMQPYFMPYIGYFQLINAVDEFVIYDDVQYMKRGWINRNNILINGEKRLLTLSVSNASTTRHINEVSFADDFVKIKKTIMSAYAKAPYYSDVVQLLDKIILYEDKNVARFIANSLTVILDYLSIETKLLFSSEIKNDKAKRGQEKILEICQLLSADRYINPIGGQEIYNRELFLNNNIELRFIQSKEYSYAQFDNSFVPWLSIIDILMFNSPHDIGKMMESYDLV